jgi:hypothetical protein
MSLIVLLTAEAFAQDFRDDQAVIRDVLAKHFKILEAPQRAALEARISKAFEALPRNPRLREQALRHIGDCALSATSFLSAADGYRTLTARDPRFLPLVMPDEYYSSAYEAGVQRMEADLAHARRFEGRDLALMSQVDLQLETLKANAKRIVDNRLTGIQIAPAEMARRKIDEIVDGFRTLQTDPFFFCDRPLAQEQYASLVQALHDRVLNLPILVSEGEGESVPIETHLSNALEPLYLFPRLSRPAGFEARDRLVRLESAARAWMEEAKARHQDLLVGVTTVALPATRVPVRATKPLFLPPKREDSGILPAQSEPSVVPRESDVLQDPPAPVGRAIVMGAIALALSFVLWSYRAGSKI